MYVEAPRARLYREEGVWKATEFHSRELTRGLAQRPRTAGTESGRCSRARPPLLPQHPAPHSPWPQRSAEMRRVRSEPRGSHSDGLRMRVAALRLAGWLAWPEQRRPAQERESISSSLGTTHGILKTGRCLLDCFARTHLLTCSASLV